MLIRSDAPKCFEIFPDKERLHAVRDISEDRLAVGAVKFPFAQQAARLTPRNEISGKSAKEPEIEFLRTSCQRRE